MPGLALLVTIFAAAPLAQGAPASVASPRQNPSGGAVPEAGYEGTKVGAPDDAAADDAAIQERVEDDSASLRQLHAAEVEAHVSDEPAPKEVADAAAELGLESPLRQRVAAALQRELDAASGSGARIPGLPEIEHDLLHLQAKYDIPVDVNEAVVAYVRFFQSPKVRPHFVRWLARAPRYVPRFRAILREEGVPEDTVYLAMIESGFANLATSRAKAVGPWQFIPATGKRFGLRQDFWVDERRDPEKAARAAARFLKGLHAQTGDWRLAWAAYNAGPGRIATAKRLGYSEFWEMTRTRRALPRETRAYVPKIMAAAIIAKHAAAFGFDEDELEPERWIENDEVELPGMTELSFAAEAAQVPVNVLLDLNPELRRTCTPPRRYALKIPRDSARSFATNWPRISQQAARAAVARHQVRRGETLAAIAGAYDVPAAVVASLNKVSPRRRLKTGTVLVVPLGSVARREAEAIARRNAPAARKVRIRRGDSLSSIARHFGVTVKDLARWNGILDPERHNLLAGRVLTLEKRTRPAVHVPKVRHGKQVKRAAAAAPRKVRVRPGDSLWSLSRRFGVEIQELARWNGIHRPHEHKLRAGRLLVVLPRAATARGR
jgi:membrane-bound lytic murein transglycosylase D